MGLSVAHKLILRLHYRLTFSRLQSEDNEYFGTIVAASNLLQAAAAVPPALPVFISLTPPTTSQPQVVSHQVIQLDDRERDGRLSHHGGRTKNILSSKPSHGGKLCCRVKPRGDENVSTLSHELLNSCEPSCHNFNNSVCK